MRVFQLCLLLVQLEDGACISSNALGGLGFRDEGLGFRV